VSPAQQPLVSHYYHGYIPTIRALGSDGKVIYNRAGETEPRLTGTRAIFGDCSIQFEQLQSEFISQSKPAPRPTTLHRSEEVCR
jgi:hypothetical protein